MTTVEKIYKEIIRTKEKIAELQKKVRTLEARKIEEQNLQIVKLVKAVNIDNKTLTELLKAYAKGEFVLPEESPIATLEEKKPEETKPTVEQAAGEVNKSIADGNKHNGKSTTNPQNSEKPKEVKNIEKKHN